MISYKKTINKYKNKGIKDKTISDFMKSHYLSVN